MLAKPRKPGKAKQWFDQEAMPAAINAASVAETFLEQVAAATRQSPTASLATGFLMGLLLGRVMAGGHFRRPPA